MNNIGISNAAIAAGAKTEHMMLMGSKEWESLTDSIVRVHWIDATKHPSSWTPLTELACERVGELSNVQTIGVLLHVGHDRLVIVPTISHDPDGTQWGNGGTSIPLGCVRKVERLASRA